MPLLIWGAIALGGVLGIGGTIATTDAAVEIGDAVDKSSKGISRMAITAGIVGAGYLYAKSKKWI